MISALLFDLGGTLDGDGIHWLDRFETAYASAGVAVARPALRAAFDEAERRAAMDDAIMGMRLDEMVDRHVGWQLDVLVSDTVAENAVPAWISSGKSLAQLRASIVRAFVEPIRRVAATNVALLKELRSRGFLLGVVSNGCGNVDQLCDDLGFTPFLSAIVDSRRVGLFKPSPAIYTYAAGQLALPPSAIMMIGDSFDRDVLPAASIGMQTAWLQGATPRPCPDPSLVGACLSTLTELPRTLEARARTVA